MLDFIKAVAACQILGPSMMFDNISLHGLMVTHVEVIERGLSDETYDYLNDDDCFASPKEELPKRMIIDGVAEGYVGLFHIGINLENHVVESAYWSHLTNSLPSDSGDLGVILFGLPAIALTAPFWGAHNLIMQSVKMVTGMDHHTYMIWKKLKGQMPTELREDLKEALINHCNGVEAAHLQKLIRERSSRLRKSKWNY